MNTFVKAPASATATATTHHHHDHQHETSLCYENMRSTVSPWCKLQGYCTWNSVIRGISRSVPGSPTPHWPRYDEWKKKKHKLYRTSLKGAVGHKGGNGFPTSFSSCPRGYYIFNSSFFLSFLSFSHYIFIYIFSLTQVDDRNLNVSVQWLRRWGSRSIRVLQYHITCAECVVVAAVFDDAEEEILLVLFYYVNDARTRDTPGWTVRNVMTGLLRSFSGLLTLPAWLAFSE